MKNITYRYRPKGSAHYRWTTRHGMSKREIQAMRDREGLETFRQIGSVARLGLALMLKEGRKPRISRIPSFQQDKTARRAAAQRQLEEELHLPVSRRAGGDRMDLLDRKITETFQGKVVRKDLTTLMKKGANVPTYVLEYLLGMYCTTEDEREVKNGLEKIKKILSENYVRPDQSEYVKSKIKENGQYTIIDKITVEVDEREDKYIARFTNLDLSPFEVSSDLVVHNEKLLVGGIWCIVKIDYVGLDRLGDEDEFDDDIFDGGRKKRRRTRKKKSKYDSPFEISALKPIQMANLDLDEIRDARTASRKSRHMHLPTRIRML